MALDEEFDLRLRALGTAAREAGFDPRITSGYRSGFDQARAINSVAQKVLGRPAGILDYARGIPGYAAPVGGSQHQKGLAADWATGPALNWLRQNAPRYGVRFPENLAKTDPIHSEIDSKFYGPVQDPRAREDQTVAAFDTKQPPTRMALGNPPAQAAPAPAPTGAPPMADPYRPQPRGGFLGLIDALQGGMSSPLFQSGAAMYSAASQGKDIGTGFLMGGEAAGRAAKSQAEQARMQRETMAQQQRDQMWQQLTSGQTPAWASGLPAGTLDLAKALGPEAGLELVSRLALAKPDKTGTQKDYEYAKSQGFTGSLMDFTKAQNESKRPTTNIDMKGETAEAAALGKGSGEAAVDMYKKANASQQQLRSLSQMQANLERVRSGRTAGIVRDVAAWAKDLGVPADVLERMGIPKTFVGDAQAFDALSSRALVNMIGAGGFPANNFSNADRAFLEQTIAQLPKDPRGNRIIIETAKRAAQADVEKAQAFAAWKTQPENKGKSFFDFDTAYAASVSDRFTDLVQESRKLLESAGDGYTTPQTQAQSAGQLAQPNVNQNPAAIIGNVRQQLQSGQIQVPQIVEQARRAIQEGKDPAGIRQRLQDFGINPADVGL